MASALSGRHTGTVIAAATLGVYALLMVGATTAFTDASAACGAWPTCNGQWVVAVDDPLIAVAWGHRLLAVVVGLLVLTAGVLGWRTGDRRTRMGLSVAVVLYPVQVSIGAATVLTDGGALLAGLHLVVGMAIFSGLLVALAWTLETSHPRAGHLGRTTPNPHTGDPASSMAKSDQGGSAASISVASFRRRLWGYFRLMKPRLMWLLCLVAAAGMALAAGSSLSLYTVGATLVGGVLAIGASGTFNHVLERDIDRQMNRTADRPLATDEVGVRNATVFGLLLTATSLIAFLSVNLLAAALGLAAILYYSVVYTLMLKPNTVQNTVIGGLAGAFPAVIGAAAATNTIGAPALLLALVIFLWTPAHFYNLALAYKDDYARGGFPMLPIVRGESTTRRHILFYAGATFIAALLLSAVGDLGWVYALITVVFSAGFLWAIVALHRNPSTSTALRSFYASNAYLGAVLVAVIVDTIAV